jgi:hypothetical protein
MEEFVVIVKMEFLAVHRLLLQMVLPSLGMDTGEIPLNQMAEIPDCGFMPTIYGQP